MKTKYFELSVTDQELLLKLVKDAMTEHERTSYPIRSHRQMSLLESLKKALTKPVEKPHEN